jgi:hypothetical protein
MLLFGSRISFAVIPILFSFTILILNRKSLAFEPLNINFIMADDQNKLTNKEESK